MLDYVTHNISIICLTKWHRIITFIRALLTNKTDHMYNINIKKNVCTIYLQWCVKIHGLFANLTQIENEIYNTKKYK